MIAIRGGVVERMKEASHAQFSCRSRAAALAVMVTVSLLSALGAPAHADPLAGPINAVAREHLTTGNRYYRVREFEKAIEEYKTGAVREDAPVFYYNLGQCYRQLGRYADAIWHYERFLDRGRPTGELEASVEKFIAQMKGELEKAAMKQPPVEPAPPATGPAGSRPTTPASSPALESRRSLPLRRRLASGIGATGVVVVGLGVGLGLRAESFEGDADAICPMTICERADEATRLIDRGRTNALYANVAFGIGGSAILAATILWITGAPREHKGAAIVPKVSRSFTGITAAIRF
jgi:tetratricopeptide (TPR) repeat protein